MGHSIKSLGKVQYSYIYLLTIVVGSQKVMRGCQELGLTGVAGAKTMV